MEYKNNCFSILCFGMSGHSSFQNGKLLFTRSYSPNMMRSADVNNIGRERKKIWVLHLNNLFK